DRERTAARLDGVRHVLAVEPGQRLLESRIIWLDHELRPHATLLDGTDADALLEGNWADLDGDGRPELIEAAASTANARPAPVVLRLPHPDGGMAQAPWPAGSEMPWRFEPCGECAMQGSPVLRADLDGDGRAEDIVQRHGALQALQRSD
ncbi:MAG: hypothetical protein ACK4L7_06745, partial [Flavobacteriales bacterium]